MLCAYHWPSNVRELENCIERAVIISATQAITESDLPPSLQTPQSTNTSKLKTEENIDFNKMVSDFDETRVSFSEISPEALEWYLDNCTYLDKAGAYAIQEQAAMFIRGIEGDFFNVVGLPVSRLCALSEQQLGIPFYTLTSNFSKGGQK